MSTINFSEIEFMVVDDDPVIVKLLQRILQDAGAKSILTATNGIEAIDALTNTNNAFDIILCDLNMPEMDGIEFLNRVANENKFDGAILLLSGEDDRMLQTAYDLAKAHQLNMIGAIQKKLLMTETINRIQEKYKPYRVKKKHVAVEPITLKELESGIKTHSNAIQLYYQPKVAIRDRSITGVEILARWEHPERGTLLPGAFIPLAEQTGLIDALTDIIYTLALRQVSQWRAAGIDITASINISVNSFASSEFADLLLKTAASFGVEPSSIILEITESEIMTDMIKSLEMMMHLRMRKFGLSIDDFGTGHSSMEKLKQIPFTELKIDRAFVRDANKNSAARVIVESSVELAKKLNMLIVAEGVETHKHWQFAEKMGCDIAQGFYCAAPMSNVDFEDFLKYWNSPH